MLQCISSARELHAIVMYMYKCLAWPNDANFIPLKCQQSYAVIHKIEEDEKRKREMFDTNNIKCIINSYQACLEPYQKEVLSHSINNYI